jgi:hypothetical protein
VLASFTARREHAPAFSEISSANHNIVPELAAVIARFYRQTGPSAMALGCPQETAATEIATRRIGG